MKRPEQDLHRAVARYLDLALPTDAWWSTIPAGGGGKLRGAFLKAMGYRAGTPDLIIVYRGKAHWIELKAPGGRRSEAQRQCGIALLKAGAHVSLAFSLDEVPKLLDFWKIPTRARLAS